MSGLNMQNGGIGSWMKLMGFDKAKKHKKKEKQNASQILQDNRYIKKCFPKILH